MTREKMSRPNSSVPNQCATEGGANRAGKLSAAGSCGASSGANIANTTKMITITAPAAAKGRLRACRTVAENEFELIIKLELELAICETSYGIANAAFSLRFRSRQPVRTCVSV